MNTLPFEARLRVETLASLDRWYREAGHVPRTRSDLIFMIVEDFASALEASGKLRRFTSLNEAAEHLSKVFGSLGKPGRGERSLLSARRAEALLAEGFSASYLEPVTKKRLSDEEIRKAVEEAAANLRAQSGDDAL